MKIYCNGKNYDLYNGSMLDLQEYIKPNSIDSIVTDPPYELGFMGKEWDSTGIAFQKETWQKLLTVMKPGGYLLVFGGSRTFHRIACSIEDAGFEIRDTIMWIYGSGFPKSQNVGLEVCKKLGEDPVCAGLRDGTFVDYKQNGKNIQEIQGINKLSFGSVSNAPRKEIVAYKGNNEWDGWGTCLKPAFEPIIVARKPLEGSTADNIIKWGTGALNIDECRVPMSDNEPDSRVGTDAVNNSTHGFWQDDMGDGNVQLYKDNGRFPANVILTYDETDKDEVCGGMPDSGNGNGGLPYNYFGR